MKLTNPTDAELNAAFAEKVAGVPCAHDWKSANGTSHRGGAFICTKCSKRVIGGINATASPAFTSSADAVLPWLEKQGFWTCQFAESEGYVVSDDHMDANSENMAEAKTFPLAAVLFLLRAHGVTVEFTEDRP